MAHIGSARLVSWLIPLPLYSVKYALRLDSTSTWQISYSFCVFIRTSDLQSRLDIQI